MILNAVLAYTAQVKMSELYKNKIADNIFYQKLSWNREKNFTAKFITEKFKIFNVKIFSWPALLTLN